MPGEVCVFRVGAPLILVTTFSALLAWGYTGGQSATEPRIPDNALPVAASQVQITPASWRDDRCSDQEAMTETARKSERRCEQLTLDQARKIAAQFARAVRSAIWRSSILTPDRRLSFVNNQRKAGTTNFLVLQKQNGSFDSARRDSSTLKDSVTRAGALKSLTPMKMVMRNCCSPERLRAKAEPSGASSCSYRMTSALTRCR